MSCTTVIAEFKAALATVTSLKANLDYEPRSVVADPFSYLLLDSFTREQPGYGVKITYTGTLTVCVEYDETATAEAAIRGYVNTIPAAVEGVYGCSIASGEVGFLPIAGKEYRVVRFPIALVEVVAPGAG